MSYILHTGFSVHSCEDTALTLFRLKKLKLYNAFLVINQVAHEAFTASNSFT